MMEWNKRKLGGEIAGLFELRVYTGAAGQVREGREAPPGTCIASLLFLMSRMIKWWK